ncbi:MAG: SDR family NAD(P)-dependent oxidoreductase, partial [Verrucomicrobiales bacterium]
MSNSAEPVAVVTGAGRGIGLAVARRLAAGGVRVAVLSRTEANAEAAAAAINEENPGRAQAYAVDVADGEAMVEVGKRILADFSKVSILVNNAGIARDNLV